MYKAEQLKNMLFVDIETASSHENYESFVDSLGPNSSMEEWWADKAQYLKKDRIELSELSNAEMYNTQAAIFPEWGRIVCITIGQVKLDQDNNPVDFKMRSFAGEDEKQILEEFLPTLSAIFSKAPSIRIVGFNIKGFDIPYICKKAMIHGVKLPYQLHLQNVKPWDNCLLDISDIWKFGGWNGAKLGVVCEVMCIPSPKEQLAGGEVSATFWRGDLKLITEYCERDVKATANVLLKMSGFDTLALDS